MYCMNCGVKLADSETCCPLCGTAAYHPDLPQAEAVPAYPGANRPRLKPVPKILPFFLTILVLLAAITVTAVDLGLSPGLSFGGYTLGSLGLFYVLFILPAWFRRPNPIFLILADTAAIEVFLLVIDLVNHGGWFMSFAFPVAGILGIIVLVEAILLRYVPKGALYTLGGGFIALGGYTMLLEMFAVITFGGKMFRWSIYTLSVLSALGLFLIFTGICHPWREMLRRKLFL